MQVFGEMTTIFPLLVAETFAKMRIRLAEAEKSSKNGCDK